MESVSNTEGWEEIEEQGVAAALPNVRRRVWRCGGCDGKDLRCRDVPIPVLVEEREGVPELLDLVRGKGRFRHVEAVTTPPTPLQFKFKGATFGKIG